MSLNVLFSKDVKSHLFFYTRTHTHIGECIVTLLYNAIAMWWEQANGLRRCFKRKLHTFSWQSQYSVICEDRQRKKLRSPIRFFGARLSINAVSYVYENREYVLHTLSSAQWLFNIQIWMNRIHEIIRVQKDETNDRKNLNVPFRDTKKLDRVSSDYEVWRLTMRVYCV